MPKCQRVFNLFGMKHLQALMLGFVYAIDKTNMLALSLLANQNRTRPPGNLPQERIWAEEFDLVYKYRWAPGGLGRLLVSFIILRVNNKYILLTFAVIEMVVLLIGHALFMQKGTEAFQYTYLVVLFIQGARWPLAINILSKWSTTKTLTLLLWTFRGSQDFFASIFYHIVGNLKQYGSTTSNCVYLTVVIKSTFFVLWIIFGSGDPIHNIFISREELLELRDEHRLRLKCHWKQRSPWKKILRTPIIYGCLVFHTAYTWYRTWDTVAFVYTFPQYRQTHYWLPLFWYYLEILLCGVIAFLIDFIIKKNKTTLNNIRKTCAAISAWGGGCCFLLAGASLGRETATSSFMTLNRLFHLCNEYYDAVLILHAISPNYLGYTYCIMSAISTFSLGLVQIVDTTLVGTGEDSTRTMSHLLFYYGFLMYFGCLLMLLAGHCRRREYDTFNTVPWKEDSIMSFP